MQQYIGITDFSDIQQVRRIKALFEHQNKFVPMIGVMMSYETLHGLPTKWAAAWPTHDALPGIFSEKKWVMNTLHFADYKHQSNANDWIAAVKLCGDNLHAIQFDMTWPAPYDIERFSEMFPNLSIILQVGAGCMEVLDETVGSHTPQDVVRELWKYDNFVNYVLFDMSAGKGKPMDSSTFIPYIRQIKNDTHLSTAVAGGLGPETTHLLNPLIEAFGPTFSIDAQGKLKRSGSALDPMDPDLAELYAKKSLELLR